MKRHRPQPKSPGALAFPPLALAALLATAGTWAYATSFAGVLLLDDTTSIATNPTIRRIWPLSHLIDVPQEATVSGRPVANFSLAVNYALAPAEVRDVFSPVARGAPPGQAERFLRNVWGYHLLNLLIHLAASLALFGVVRRTLSSRRMPAHVVGAATWLSLAAALVWLVHPLQTAAVTYVVQRVESLMGLFYLLTLYSAIRAREGPRALFWSVAAITSCALAMGTKEVAVTAPLMVVCWDVVFGTRDRRVPEAETPPGRAARKARRARRGSSEAEGPRRRWPLYLGLAATWVVLALLVAREPREHSVGLGLASWTPWTYLLTQSGVIVHYLRLSVFPSPLVFLYAWPMAASPGDVAPQLVLVALLVVATAVGLVRRHPLGFAGAWFFAILAPSSSVLPIITEVAAEHRLYLPLAAIATCAVVGAFLLGRAALAQAFANPASRARAGAALAVALTAGLVLAFGIETRARNRDYWSQERIWQDTIAKQPDNPRAHIGYGISLMALGRYQQADSELSTAVRLDETNPVAQGQLGATMLALGSIDDAIGHLEKALAVWPDYADAQRSAGLAYAARGDDAQAFRHLARAVQTYPNDPLVLSRLARIAATSSDESLRHAPLALELSERAARATSRTDARLLDQLAAAQAGVERYEEAAATSEEALRVARAQGDPALIAELEQRLGLYQALAKSRGRRQ